MDIHKDYQEYIDAKRNIYLHQTKDDLLVINYDNDITREFADTAKGNVRFFSTYTRLYNGVVLDQNIIKSCVSKVRTQIINADDILLLGRHNVENACTAIAAVQDLVKKGKKMESWEK